MVRKSDRDDPDRPNGDAVIDTSGGDDLDDDETEEVSTRTADAESADHKQADPHDPSGAEPDHAVPRQPSEDETLEPGYILTDRFEIVELVHSGGMGHVYKAIDRRRHMHGSDQIYVAIKMTRRSVVPEADASLILEREAAQAQRLSHPNIVNIFDFDVHDDQFYLVLEWLEGESVKDLLLRTRGRRLAPEFVWQIIHGVASGLQHAHSNNVVHADINLSNIFITDTQQIKLLDFGVARHIDDPEETKDGEFVWVTRKYASPDVLSGSSPVFEDDIFSLACVAYRLLSGKHPFSGLNAVEAEKVGVTVQAIPGLSEPQWQTLRRALSFSRSERPNTVSAFLPELPASTGTGFVERRPDRRLANWPLVLPAAAIGLAAGLWWLSQQGVEGQVTAISELPPVETGSTLDTAAASAPSELEQLLSAAAQVMQEERYVTPEDDNARDLYRDVLALEPANAVALSGLRTISDIYVQQANVALRSAAPEEVTGALSIAADTDPDNPAIAIVNDLLLAQGNAALANARLAAAEGDIDLAASLLSEAERYAPIDVNEINAVRLQIAQSVEEQQFLRRLAAADAHISAGRLIAPEGNNAHALLVELRKDDGDDARLRASLERLSERLQAAAVVAWAADRIAEASAYLDAADALGVTTAEIAATRMSLLRDEQSPPDANVATVGSAATKSTQPSTMVAREPDVAARVENAVAEPSPLPAADTDVATAAAAVAAIEPEAVESVAQPAVSDRVSEEASPVRFAVAEPSPMQATTAELWPATVTAASDSGTLASDELSQPRISNLADLDIEKYVAPTYPRRAQRLRLTGSVELRFRISTDGTTDAIEIIDAEPNDVFVSSAEKAVKQWRFAPRDYEEIARIRMRFE